MLAILDCHRYSSVLFAYIPVLTCRLSSGFLTYEVYHWILESKCAWRVWIESFHPVVLRWSFGFFPWKTHLGLFHLLRVSWLLYYLGYLKGEEELFRIDYRYAYEREAPICNCRAQGRVYPSGIGRRILFFIRIDDRIERSWYGPLFVILDPVH